MAWEGERVWITGEVFPYSRKQVNRAGDRIRRARTRGEDPIASDLSLLDLFRSSHYPALREVHDRLARRFFKHERFDPERTTITARPLKTQAAIIAKLVREKTRLSVIQDIAGTRVVVGDRATQDWVTDHVLTRFPKWHPRLATTRSMTRTSSATARSTWSR